jgi:outer membrane protein OmpA-like peptidoglycan-associated protein
MGAQGVPGELQRGGAGRVGAAGPTGAQGATGETGAQGASTVGFAGPTGATGATGAQGAIGATGPQGATLYGPSGPAGYAGGTGAQGGNGAAGVQGSTTAGVAGSVGYTGATGASGVNGPQGNVGVAGIVGQWTLYRTFIFSYNDAQIQDTDSAKSGDIAAYMKANPSLEIGIDGTMDPRGTDPKDQGLDDRRVETVRASLVAAGVPANRIKIGTFGNPQTRGDRRIEVLFATGN